MQSHRQQLLSFQVDEVECAVDLSLVHEVIRFTDLMRLPGLEGTLAGAIDWQGELLPVINLRQRFGCASRHPDEHTRILLVHSDGYRLGLIVDALGEVFLLRADGSQPAPAWMSAISAPYIQGLRSIDGRWLTILDPAKLLPGDMEALAVPPPSILESPRDGQPEITADAPPPPKRSWRDLVSRQPATVAGLEVTLQSALDSQSLRELEEMARAMSEGDFYRQMSTKIQEELEHLAAYIGKTMANLRILEPSLRISVEQDMAAASQQLSAVVKSTEEATNTIISLTETLLDHQSTLGDALEKLKRQKYRGRDSTQLIEQLDHLRQEDEKALIEILTSLSFQDLTGQRIHGIVTMVATVQAKLSDLIRAFGIKVQAEEKEAGGDAAGPVPGGEEGKLAQDSVDSLLNQLFK